MKSKEFEMGSRAQRTADRDGHAPWLFNGQGIGGSGWNAAEDEGY